MASIISASRRTDIPSFYGRWFEERLAAGHVSYRNPFDARKVYRVSLAADDVLAFVFWSKDFGPFLPVLRRMTQSHSPPVLFNYTITGYGTDLESHLPDLAGRMEAVGALGLLYSPQNIFWRYDTIVITDVYTRHWHKENIRRLCERLAGRVDRCIISFLQVYSKVARNLRGVGWETLEPAEETDLARELAMIVRSFGLPVYSCCQDHLTGEDVLPSACIDGEHLRRLHPERFPDPLPTRGTRRGCRCAASRDIGAYNTCGHGCRYCYAVSDHKRARRATEETHGETLT